MHQAGPAINNTASANLPALPDRRGAEQVVAEGIRRWAATRRAGADAFVARHYSLRGSLALHGHALGNHRVDETFFCATRRMASINTSGAVRLDK